VSGLISGSVHITARPGRGTERIPTIVSAALFTVLSLFTILSCSRPAHIVWERRYDAGPGDFGTSVSVDCNDIVVGTTCYDSAAGPGSTAWKFLRSDRNGNLQWQRSYPRGKHDSLAAIAVGPDHDIVAVGSTRPIADGDSVRLLLAKFTAHGALTWSKELALGLVTRGVALKLDSLGRITVSGSVRAEGDAATSDMLFAQFDSLGNLLDHEALDFGGDENGQDLIQARAGGFSIRTKLIIIAGVRIPLPGKNDSSTTSDVVVACLDPDHNIVWRDRYDSGGDDLWARLVWNQGPYLVVTSQTDHGVGTRLLAYGFWYHDVSVLHDTLYSGEPNASCLALTPYRNGGFLGVGAAGPAGHQHCLGWRFFRGKFETFLSGDDTLGGKDERADAVKTDADGNAVISGTSNGGGNSSILLIKVAPPRYIPPPNLPWGTGGGPN